MIFAVLQIVTALYPAFVSFSKLIKLCLHARLDDIARIRIVEFVQHHLVVFHFVFVDLQHTVNGQWQNLNVCIRRTRRGTALLTTMSWVFMTTAGDENGVHSFKRLKAQEYKASRLRCSCIWRTILLPTTVTGELGQTWTNAISLHDRDSRNTGQRGLSKAFCVRWNNNNNLFKSLFHNLSIEKKLKTFSNVITAPIRSMEPTTRPVECHRCVLYGTYHSHNNVCNSIMVNTIDII